MRAATATLWVVAFWGATTPKTRRATGTPTVPTANMPKRVSPSLSL